WKTLLGKISPAAETRSSRTADSSIPCLAKSSASASGFSDQAETSAAGGTTATPRNRSWESASRRPTFLTEGLTPYLFCRNRPGPLAVYVIAFFGEGRFKRNARARRGIFPRGANATEACDVEDARLVHVEAFFLAGVDAEGAFGRFRECKIFGC